MTARKILFTIMLMTLAAGPTGCSSYGKKIGIGMIAGGAAGAVVGHQFIHHGRYKQYQTRNTIITSVIMALLTGGALAWHYRALEEQKVEISGRFARYRLCDSSEFQLSEEPKGSIYQINKEQIGSLAIFLDDNTKWAYPVFRKRLLPPEHDENQVISQRYVWEIIKPGSFVTRSQNPDYFSETEVKK